MRRWVPLSLFLIYLAGRVAVVTGGTVFTAHDSWVYAYREDPTQNLGPLVSFTGHAPRSWGAPLFLVMFPDDHWRAVGQWAFATVVWAFLAWAVARQVSSFAAKTTALAAVLGLALLTTVNNWDFAILSESLSLSIGALVLGLFLIWAQGRSNWVLAGMTLAAVWWTFVRPDIRLFTAVIILVLVFIAWRERPRVRARVLPPLVAALTLVLAVGWYAAISPTMDRTFIPYSGTALPEMTNAEEFFVYRLRVDVSTDPELTKVFHEKLGMPACAGTDDFPDTNGWDSVAFSKEYLKCPELRAWGLQHMNSFWPSLVKADPVAGTRKFLEITSQTFGGDVYAQVPHVVPAPLEKAVFPSWRFGLPVALLGLAVAVALAWGSGARRALPRLWRTGLVLAGTSLVSAAGAVYMGSGEYRRFGMQETVLIRLAMILLVVAAVEAWARKRAAAEPVQVEEPVAV